MKHRGLAIVIVAMCFALPFAGESEAGCWKCNTSKDCVAVGPGENGFEGCWDVTHCTTQCDSTCGTSGGSCTGTEGPSGPESQGHVTPNGDPLRAPFLLPPPEVPVEADHLA